MEILQNWTAWHSEPTETRGEPFLQETSSISKVTGAGLRLETVQGHKAGVPQMNVLVARFLAKSSWKQHTG